MKQLSTQRIVHTVHVCGCCRIDPKRVICSESISSKRAASSFVSNKGVFWQCRVEPTQRVESASGFELKRGSQSIPRSLSKKDGRNDCSSEVNFWWSNRTAVSLLNVSTPSTAIDCIWNLVRHRQVIIRLYAHAAIRSNLDVQSGGWRRSFTCNKLGQWPWLISSCWCVVWVIILLQTLQTLPALRILSGIFQSWFTFPAYLINQTLMRCFCWWWIRLLMV